MLRLLFFFFGQFSIFAKKIIDDTLFRNFHCSMFGGAR